MIEDHPSNRRLIKDVLEHERYVVHLAPDGEAGLALAADLQPELVLLDIGLPGTDGLTVARRLRASARTRDIPIIAIPFYVFSIRKGRHSGLLTPNFDFGLGGTGRSFSNLGYYWAASPYWDLTFSADYTENSNRLVGQTIFNYKKRYLMDGKIDFSGASGWSRATTSSRATR